LGDFEPQREALFGEWDAAAEREKRSRTMFAQETIKPAEVVPELQAVRAAIGSGVDVERFVREAIRLHGGVITEQAHGQIRADLGAVPRALRERIGMANSVLTAGFELPLGEGIEHLNRTHPVVEAIATHILDTALDGRSDGVARRCGVIRTGGVERRTTLLLVRFRYHIITRKGNDETPLLAEDCQILGFAGAPQSAVWLESEGVEELLRAEPGSNVAPDQASDFLRKVVDGYEAHLRPRVEELARSRGRELLEAHRRVRQAARLQGATQEVVPKLPPDVLGIFVCLPRPS
jgi:hypothetical protein